ncbi:hypothetical protein TRFO_10810 [Tritrichomonas foetus]|uniref:Uncharacterized protein n=1 Tax=Tritrichomonas foetus TaxID=1144522 RepID=A0A1J4J9F1_9EUKA|nr:hypothetical protein TRFO_10810 [Tritrichomonas foetus]|eukprot:OHS94879.1 hypothetical protein TRFO_10810 [Tritrichomonas foetus]
MVQSSGKLLFRICLCQVIDHFDIEMSFTKLFMIIFGRIIRHILVMDNLYDIISNSENLKLFSIPQNFSLAGNIISAILLIPPTDTPNSYNSHSPNALFTLLNLLNNEHDIQINEGNVYTIYLDKIITFIVLLDFETTKYFLTNKIKTYLNTKYIDSNFDIFAYLEQELDSYDINLQMKLFLHFAKFSDQGNVENIFNMLNKFYSLFPNHPFVTSRNYNDNYYKEVTSPDYIIFKKYTKKTELEQFDNDDEDDEDYFDSSFFTILTPVNKNKNRDEEVEQKILYSGAFLSQGKALYYGNGNNFQIGHIQKYLYNVYLSLYYDKSSMKLNSMLDFSSISQSDHFDRLSDLIFEGIPNSINDIEVQIINEFEEEQIISELLLILYRFSTFLIFPSNNENIDRKETINDIIIWSKLAIELMEYAFGNEVSACKYVDNMIALCRSNIEEMNIMTMILMLTIYRCAAIEDNGSKKGNKRLYVPYYFLNTQDHENKKDILRKYIPIPDEEEAANIKRQFIGSKSWDAVNPCFLAEQLIPRFIEFCMYPRYKIPELYYDLKKDGVSFSAQSF